MVLPELMKLCSQKDLELDKFGKFSNHQIEEYIKQYKELRQKFHKLKKDHHNIVGMMYNFENAFRKK